jgi:hypothetical protein
MQNETHVTEYFSRAINTLQMNPLRKDKFVKLRFNELALDKFEQSF